MIRAAVFDLDGVVLDSMSIWKDLGARYLLRRGLTPEPGLGELLFSMSMEQGADYLRTHYPCRRRRTCWRAFPPCCGTFITTRSPKRTEPTRPWRFYRAAA